MSSRCVSVAMVLVGAWLSQAWAQAPGEAQPSGSRTFLWESFEAGQAWSADAGVGTVRSEEHPSEGLYALKVSFHKPTDSCELRRDTRLDLTQMEALSLDTYGDLTRASVALVIETAQGGRFRSPARSIERGWNRDVRFDLTTGDFNQAAGTAGVKLTGHDVVVRMGFVFQPDPAAQSGMLYLDNVRFIGAPTRAWQRAGPTVNSVTAERTQVPQYDRFELRVDLSATVSNWFDPDELNLVASILTPSGRRLDMPGFLAGYRQQGLEPPEPVWLIRFSPDELGLYRYSVSVTTELGRAVSPERTFTCVANPGVPGFVRVSPRDRRYFQTDDGRFFYPIGQNVAWSVDYESYFRKMHDAGENWVRVWICPWNCWLERKGSLGRYDLAAAARLDDILALADKYDLYVQLVLVWHGLQDQAWQDNPYNQANGGPCRFAGDFYTDPRARMFFQRTLRYIVARYGWSRRIFAWELFNEVDLGQNHHTQDIIDWHRQMSAYLHAIDVHGHLVTSSGFSREVERELWKLPDIGFANPHLYRRADLPPAMAELAVDAAELPKPWFLGEFAVEPDEDKQRVTDARGDLLHAGLWSSFHQPGAGAAMPWWWDSQIEADNLYFNFAALSRYAAGQDRRGRPLGTVSATLAGPDKEDLRVQGLLDSAGGYLWIYDARLLTTPPRTFPTTGTAGAAAPAPQPVPPLVPVKPGTGLTVGGLLDGPYMIEFWDTRKGKVASLDNARCNEGRLTLELPGFTGDLAVKLRFTGDSRPTIAARPATPTTP